MPNLEDREKLLSELEVDEQIAQKRMSIAEKRSIEKEMRQRHGRNWKKVLGIVGNIRVNPEALQTLYASSPSLRETSIPRGVRRA